MRLYSTAELKVKVAFGLLMTEVVKGKLCLNVISSFFKGTLPLCLPPDSQTVRFLKQEVVSGLCLEEEPGREGIRGLP